MRIESFDGARRAALMKDLLGLLHNRPTQLLKFDEVRSRLKLKQVIDRGVMEVPLDKIVGTVGREGEFNRAFLPREEALRDRWEEVKDLAEGPEGFPAVELYYVADIYFVVDGHHRVSVARAVGAPSIEARVKEFPAAVSLDSNASIEEIILRSARADFLETTGLKPENDSDYLCTSANGCEKLLDHISVHRYFRGIETGREVSREEAVRSWRDTLYLPMLDTIRKSGIMEDFPGFTETDLYIFTMDHLHHLKQTYGGDHPRHEAVEDLRKSGSRHRGRRRKMWFREKG
jgi:hypothetical protein